ncbi:hypothetical protein EMIHUDRAFT_100849 [Emiliania huxleyi CCMP1516]|uniref:Uncharacterized protein n=2 Tax=Emiliania huxleyi TaxID=2903 RepID=A0A0D3JNN3_EMIH1|nr:hypothetical protein EMIHUDRAFT_100849 [Emiliania huxleyi CCMP1516]EOD25118.1 hypothetical protein EMIHUDRAFT_100849 [Emiliania huxleyi CCMP1516]|eukprot:XP_005777547.1 hypothetical protein EMIHUDRAFT_100849 [Emiliania huxleyi CCMP1516]
MRARTLKGMRPFDANPGACIFVQPSDDLRNYRECLRNKRVFVGGNSVARHLAFAMAMLLSGNSAMSPIAKLPSPRVVRDAEKAFCGTGTFGREDDAAACEFIVGQNTNITFGWEQRVYSTGLWHGLAQLQPDLLLLHAGSDDIFDADRRDGWHFRQRAEGALLAHALANLSRGIVYWRTSPRVCNSTLGQTASVLNAALQSSNLLLLSQLCGQETIKVRVADSFSWTFGRCDEYDDSIHHALLAHDHVIFLIGADDDVVLDPRLAERRRRARTSAAAAPPPAASRWAGRQSDEAIVACVGERFAELEVCVARTPEELLRSNAEAVVVISYLTQTSFAWYARFFDALRELEARGTKVYPSAAFKQLVSSKADYLLLLERTGLPVCPTRLLGQAALTEPATSSATDGSAGGSRADPVALEAALRSSLSELGLLSTREGGRPSLASRRYAPFQLVSKPSNADGGYGVAFWLGGGEAAAEGEAAVAEVPSVAMHYEVKLYFLRRQPFYAALVYGKESVVARVARPGSDPALFAYFAPLLRESRRALPPDGPLDPKILLRVDWCVGRPQGPAQRTQGGGGGSGGEEGGGDRGGGGGSGGEGGGGGGGGDGSGGEEGEGEARGREAPPPSPRSLKRSLQLRAGRAESPERRLRAAMAAQAEAPLSGEEAYFINEVEIHPGYYVDWDEAPDETIEPLAEAYGEYLVELLCGPAPPAPHAQPPAGIQMPPA